MRWQRRCTASLAPWVGAIFAITIACAWWWIIVDMKWMSAAVYGQRALSARAFAFAPSGPGVNATAFERECVHAAARPSVRRTKRAWGRRRFTGLAPVGGQSITR